MTRITRPANDMAECPRCFTQVPVYGNECRLRAHKDPICGSSCPMGGLTVAEAQDGIRAAKRRLEETWRRS